MGASQRRCTALPKGCTKGGINSFSTSSKRDGLTCSACLPGSYLVNGQCQDSCPIGSTVSQDGLSCQGNVLFLLLSLSLSRPNLLSLLLSISLLTPSRAYTICIPFLSATLELEKTLRTSNKISLASRKEK